MSTLDEPLALEPATREQRHTDDLRLSVFDSHFHIIDPRFPLLPNQGYLPPTFTIADYRASTASLQVIGGAIVTASFQGFDQRYLIAALLEMGPRFVGVAQLPPTVSDAEILELDEVGVRAVRFNLYRGGAESLTYLEAMARRVFELAGWHVELYVDARDLPDILPLLLTLPRVVIDHLGLAHAGLPSLLKLAEQGNFIKATGFGRYDANVPAALQAIYQANPHALAFGTDLPSTRAPRPFSPEDVTLIQETLGPEAAQRVLSVNATRLYKLV